MQNKFIKFIIAVLLCCCPLRTLCLASDGTINAEGNLKVFQGKVYNRISYPVHTKFAGEITDCPAQVGKHVKKGDVLLKIALTDTDLYNLEKRLDKKQTILDYSLEIEKLKQEVKLQLEQKDKAEQLFSSGMTPAKAVQDLSDLINFLNLKINHYEKSLEKVRQDLKRERSLICDWIGQKVHDTIPLYSLVKAPVDGYIVWASENLKVGSFVSGHVLTIGAMDPMIVRTQIYEAEAFYLQPGDKARVVLDFALDNPMEALVKSISWVPLDRSISHPSYYIVDLEVANPENTLKEGYRVKVTFPDSELNNVKN